MFNARKLVLQTTLVLTVMLLILVGCSNSSNDNVANQQPANSNNTNADNTHADNSNTDTQYPIVIEHALGTTTIESKPERVATIQWANHDVVLALGIVPVGFSAANYGVQDDSGLLPWTAAKLEELGVTDPNVFQDTDGLDFEAIADSNPDVILAAYSGITQEDYDILSKIAPVVAYQTSPWVTTWREQVIFNATGMGMKAEGEQLIADTEKLIQEKASEYPKMKGLKAVWANFSATDMSRINIYTAADPRGAFLEELGMVSPESISSLLEDDTSYSLRLSAENADALNDADLLFSYGDESLLQAVQADPLLGKIPAVQRGSVVVIGNGTPLAASGNPNPLSIAYTIDEYLALIGEAITHLND